MDPGWLIWKDFWLEIVMVSRSGDQMEVWLNGHKKISLDQMDGFGECADRVLCGISGRQAAQRCQKHGCWLMRTETLRLKDDICCWM